MPKKSIPAKERLSQAKRLRQARCLTKLSRGIFAEQTGLNKSTLQNWESKAIPEKNVNEVIKALLSQGVHCTREWLLHGKGPKPTFVSTAPVSSTVEATSLQLRKELDCFLNQSKEAVVYRVMDDAMAPQFNTGDYVGGLRCYGDAILEKCLGKVCLVLIQGGDLCLRTVVKGSAPGHYHLAHTNLLTQVLKPFYDNVPLVSAAPICWHRSGTSEDDTPKNNQ